jgi:predicted RNase H-like nuclease (RuvC/YqgF family)
MSIFSKKKEKKTLEDAINLSSAIVELKNILKSKTEENNKLNSLVNEYKVKVNELENTLKKIRDTLKGVLG